MTHTEPVNSYDIGAGVVLEGDFTQDSEPVEPVEVICLVRLPGSDEPTELTVEHIGTTTNDDGQDVERYRAVYLAAIPGDHYYRFGGTGDADAAREHRFYVRPSKVLAS